MRVSGLTINLPAKDSEGERVCAREREQAGGAVGEARGGDGRARVRARVRARAGLRLQSVRETPRWRGTKRGHDSKRLRAGG